MPSQRPSDVWSDAADALNDEAQLAAKSADHFARLGADAQVIRYRGAAEALNSTARAWHERARILRAKEDAELAAAQEGTTKRYRLLGWEPRRPWWRRWLGW